MWVVNRQVANAFVRVGTSTPTFGVCGPLAKGVLVEVDLAWGVSLGAAFPFGQTHLFFGLVLSGSSDATQENFNSGASLLQRGIVESTLGRQPVFSFDVSTQAPMPQVRFALSVLLPSGPQYVILGGVGPGLTLRQGAVITAAVERFVWRPGPGSGAKEVDAA